MENLRNIFFPGWTYQLMDDNQPKFNLLAAEKQCVCGCLYIYVCERQYLKEY